MRSFSSFIAATLFLIASHPLCGLGQQAKPTPAKNADDEQWRKQFKGAVLPMGKAASAPTPVPDLGKVSYTLQRPKEPTEEEQKILDGIDKAMKAAIGYYNRYTKLQKHVNVFFSPETPTADGNINGTIRVGGSRNTRTLLHELGHCMGVGQHRNWNKLMVDHRWQGPTANKLLQDFTNDPKAELHGDRMHFWPYGLNYDNEVKSDEDMIRHARLVEAIVKDLESTK